MNTTRRKLLFGGGSLLAVAAIGVREQVWAKFTDLGPVTEGSKAPELIGTPANWINTGDKALKLYGAGGLLSKDRIILVDYWDYTCVNCIRTMPHLRAWHRRYSDKGLTIIGIHTPEFEFAKEKKNVEAAVQRLKLPYPVLVDSNYANWRAYGNNYWPRKYLINGKGIVAYDHAGEGAYAETEEQIRKWLLAANPSVMLPAATGLAKETVRGRFRQTPEIYLGYLRGTPQFGSPGRLQPNAAFNYTDAGGERQDGLFYVNGRWRSLPEGIRHARATTDPFEDYVAIRYHALEANAVLKPEGGKPVLLYLLHDGKPVDKAVKGEDVQYDSKGRSFVKVDAPRMYRLIENKQWGQHELKLGSTSPDFGLYTFTFSSTPSAK